MIQMDEANSNEESLYYTFVGLNSWNLAPHTNFNQQYTLKKYFS